MKYFKKTLIFALALFFVLQPIRTFAAETPDNAGLFEFIDETESISESDTPLTGTTETGTILFTRSQITEEQQDMYDQMLKNIENGDVLEVGESRLIGSDADGEIYITCTNSSMNLTRASWQTSSKSYDINKVILGVTTTIVTVKLECSWYENGVNGYIQNLKGTYTIKNSAYTCSWDSAKTALPTCHALWLNVSSLGSSYSIMFAANYNNLSSPGTLSFDCV